MKVLLISPDWLGLSSPIVREMGNQGIDAELLDHADLVSFNYTGNVERLFSKIYNIYGKESYKQVRTNENMMAYLNGYFSDKVFDLVIMTSPDVFSDEHFKLLKSKTNKLVAILWDSLSKFPKNIIRLKEFDKVFSFEAEDCEKYNLSPITNFIKPGLEELGQPEKYEYDIFLVMTYDKVRYKLVERILNANPDLNAKILVHTNSKKNESRVNHPMVTAIRTPVLNEKLESYIKQSRIILDIGYDYQKGLSFRPFEALAWGRKLVTNNKSIETYDFYSESNVFVLGKDYKIPERFLLSKFNAISSEIRSQYSLNNWIKTVTSCARE